MDRSGSLSHTRVKILFKWVSKSIFIATSIPFVENFLVILVLSSTLENISTNELVQATPIKLVY